MNSKKTVTQYSKKSPEQCNAETIEVQLRKAKDAEVKQRNSEEQFRTLVSNIPGVVYRCANDPDWTMEFISDGVETMTGYPVSDFIKNKVRTATSIIHPEDRQKAEDLIQKALESKEPFVLEMRVLHKDGTIKWIYEKGRGVFDNDGTLIWLDGALFDITERKQVELEREKLLKELQIEHAKVKTLRGLLPICASCKKIRDDKGYWNQIEGYIQDHSDAEFSHGICPECAKKQYPELYEDE